MVTPSPKRLVRQKTKTPVFGAYVEQLRALAQEFDREIELDRGAAASTLKQLARTLGFEPSLTLKQAWQLGNGSLQGAPVFARPRCLEPYEFLSTKKMLNERAGLERRAPQYKGYKEPQARDRRIRPGWYDPGWVPFASFEGATMLLIEDHAPSVKGRVGQIIAFTHDPDRMTYVAEGFPALLEESLKMFKEWRDDLLEE